MGYCQPDIPKSIPKPRPGYHVRKFHTDEEIRQVLATAADARLWHPVDSKGFTAMILVLLDSGLRAGELCRLSVGDLDGELIKVLGKGDKERWVRLSEETRTAVQAYLETRAASSPDSPLFITRPGGERLSPSTLHKRMKRLGNAAGVKTHAHRWRHSFAASAVRNGAGVKALQHFLGHSSLETTDAYLAGFGYQDAARDHARFSPVGALTRHLQAISEPPNG